MPFLHEYLCLQATLPRLKAMSWNAEGSNTNSLDPVAVSNLDVLYGQKVLFSFFFWVLV